ncbi:TolC family protein [Sphingomonas aurantiaca]|uniref:TolC family protein n=1 Tax=Sphingomonas aurantiaca TaxID=185949 RepID=UPI002FE3AE65
MRRSGCGTVVAAGLALAAAPVSVPVYAQRTPPATQGSLVVDPQQGATPRPLPPSPALPTPSVPTPVTVSPVPAPAVGSAVPSAPIARTSSGSYGPPSPVQGTPRLGAWARGVPGGLPAPSQDPLHIDPTADPILQLAHAQSPLATFQQVIGEAVARNPSLDEAIAQADEAKGVRGEARARALPTADLSISTFRIIDRAFSNDPNNVLERSRPSHRTDGLLRVQQPLIDFGASLSRIRSSEARLNAARVGIEDIGTQIALRAVSAWYTVYGYRVLVRLGEAFATSQRSLRSSIEDRILQGAAAPGDVAQVDSYIASSDSQLAEFRRQLAGAEAQYAAVIGHAPPAALARAPEPSLAGIGTASLVADIDTLPAIRAAKLGADAARSDVRAVKSDLLPQLSGGIDAGRYGIIETARDYDIRGSLTLSMRLGGGGPQRVDQAQARADGADARLRRTRIDSQRDAEIALADVTALQDAQAAIEGNYLASRRARRAGGAVPRVARDAVRPAGRRE